MRRRLREIVQSLGFRLLFPLFLTIVAVLTIHAMLSFRATRDDLLWFVRADVNRSSGLIKRATHDAMLLNRKSEVQSTLERLAEEPEIAAIRVYDKGGTIVMSARPEEIGRKIDIRSETCRSCHEEDQETKENALMERSRLARVNGGPEVLRHLSIIENESSCAAIACHGQPADEPVLGVLDVEMSMAPLDAAIGKARRQFFQTTMILVCIVGVVAAVFIRRFVSRPVSRLYAGTQRIADGDLETRIPVRGAHELARLADAFNRMAADLSTSRREVVEWSQKLEEKVVEKTRELSRAQRQVLHMEKMASLGQLSATVAHELNNPISGVLTYARLVRRELEKQQFSEDLRAELSGYLSLVEKECLRCGGIVQNLLVFARRTGAEFAPVDLNEVVERSLMLVRHHFEISGVRVDCRRLSGDSQVMADAGQLQQAMVALLVNADEAMKDLDSGEKELTVRMHGTADEVRIDVADTGVGIPEEVLPQIFEPFFSTKEAENRVGLGLAVVYGIIRRHGGQIDVESTVGRGTVFHLQLPRRPKGKGTEDAGNPRQVEGPA